MIGGRSHRPQSFFYTASIHVYIYLNVYRHRYLLLCDIYRASKKEVRLVHSTFHDGIFFRGEERRDHNATVSRTMTNDSCPPIEQHSTTQHILLMKYIVKIHELTLIC